MGRPNSHWQSTKRSTVRLQPTLRFPTFSAAATALPDAGRCRPSICRVARNSKPFRFPLTNWRFTMAYRKRKNPADLPAKLAFVGLSATAASFNDFIARATKGRWSPVQMLEELAPSEIADHTKRNFDSRHAQHRLVRFN